MRQLVHPAGHLRLQQPVGVALRYFHGGVPGLKSGDLITPHAPNVIDGCAVRLNPHQRRTLLRRWGQADRARSR
ncbi:hypothetical protein [Streptomyces sp. NPDC086782]|uniref:hypothetical protein n=1 Tax=Streptomyces sp. NPDC086782 TaxID=3365757 RepID=UPI003828A142